MEKITLENFAERVAKSIMGDCTLYVGHGYVELYAMYDWRSPRFYLRLHYSDVIKKRYHLSPPLTNRFISLNPDRFKLIYEYFLKINIKNRLGIKRNFKKHLNRFLKKIFSINKAFPLHCYNESKGVLCRKKIKTKAVHKIN